MKNKGKSSIFKVGEEKELDACEETFEIAIKFKGKEINSKEMQTLILSLKIMKIRIPKYLLFKIFESFEEVFLVSKKNICGVYDGKIFGRKSLDPQFQLMKKNFTAILDNKKQQFCFLEDDKVNFFFFVF